MLISEVLSPVDVLNKATRRRGRFGYQVVADTISFGHNLPQRLLLCNELDKLAETVYAFLHDPLFEEICWDSHERLTKFEIADLRHLSIIEIRTALGYSCETFQEIAEEVIAEPPNGRDTKPSERTYLSNNSRLSAAWWKMLLTLRPHLERRIWLTEMSAPLPFHALCRMHDTWSLMILLWCYQNRDWFKKCQDSARAVFWTESLLIYCIGPDWFNRQALGPDQVSIVIGPVFCPTDSTKPPTNFEEDDSKLARFFMDMVERAANNIPGFEDRTDVSPTLEELRDSIGSRLRPLIGELHLRTAAVGRSWELLRQIETPTEEITLSEWEGLAGVSVWIAKFEPEISSLLNGDELSLAIKGGQRFVGVSVYSTFNACSAFRIELRDRLDDWEERRGVTETKLRNLKKQNRLLDLPVVLLSRMRERRSAYWNFQIMAINSLLQRSHTRQTRIPTQPTDSLRSARQGATNSYSREHWNTRISEAEHLLLGFGVRLGHYLANITQAHLCTIYWYDYSSNPPRLIPVSGYSRNLVLRAKTREIQWSFNCSVEERGAHQKRSQSESLLYRVCATNQPEIQDNMSMCLMDGYPPDLRPESALAMPLRHNGRVVGLLELKGLVRGQFSNVLLAPLWRAANIIGPFIFHNLFLWQIRQINELVATRAKVLWEYGRHNRLRDISLLLCNVFLCPVVHLWIKTDNQRRFKLVGFNRDTIFQDAIESNDISPTLDINLDDQPYNVSRPFAELAIKLWANGRISWGSIVKARFRDELEPTGYELENAFDIAQKRGIYLYRGFVHVASGAHKFRDQIFCREKLNEIVAFALIRRTTTSPIFQFANPDKPSAEPVEAFSTEGFITLHDYGDSDSASIGHSVGWAPVFAYMQAYLTHLLDQLEILNESWQQARNILVHEAIHIVSTTEKRLGTASRQYHDLFRGDSREALRRWVQRLPDREEELRRTVLSPDDLINLQRDVARIQRSLLAAEQSTDYLENMANRLVRLEARLKHRRDFGLLEVSPGERKAEIPLQKDINQRLRSYQDTFRAKGVHPSRLEASGNWVVMLEHSLWDRITYNALENMAKYSLPHSACEIIFRDKVLIFRNLARYNASDTPKRLRQLGQRGEMVHDEDGEGIGLWVIEEACKLSAIPLDLRIEPQQQSGIAQYRLSLDLRNVLERQD